MLNFVLDLLLLSVWTWFVLWFGIRWGRRFTPLVRTEAKAKIRRCNSCGCVLSVNMYTGCQAKNSIVQCSSCQTIFYVDT